MASKGWMGKIAHVNLTTREVTMIDSEPYVQWLGGHGLASALFWDYCEEMTIEAFDPKNLIVIATNPFSGTLAPTAASRVEVTGISAFSDHEWYSRSSLGGRIAGGMKRAGLDAFMVTGKSETPVWINVVDGKVTIEDATHLWGMDSWDSQKAIMDEITGGAGEGEWYRLKGSKQPIMTRPAVMAIAPISENLGRMGGISHDAGHIVAQNGFGAVWGAKNLKAVSFSGTQTIEIEDPDKLIAIRRELYERRDYKIDHPDEVPYDPYTQIHIYNVPGRGNVLGNFNYLPHRPEACEGCPSACRSIFPDTKANENYCVTVSWGRASGRDRIDTEETGRKNADLLNRWSINAWEVGTPAYIYSLYKRGLAGPGKQIDTGDLDFSTFGTHEFTKAILEKMVKREDFGYELSDGLARAAKAWGVWEEDSTTGELLQPCWGYGEHYSLQVETDWGYNSILGERDMNEHAFNFWVYWMPRINLQLLDVPPVMTAEKLTQMLSRVNDDLDPRCWDYSEENAYSDYRVECTYWYRHWTRVWTQSFTFCDWSWGGCRINLNDPFRDYYIDLDQYGCDLYKAVTGIDMSKKESYEIGRKIWNLDKAIWTMQGRHRDQEVFANYVYERPNPEDAYYPMIVDGEWTYASGLGRTIDREKFEDFKTRYYLREGWDPATGWPTRGTLEELDLKGVADKLEAVGKLGTPNA